ncbi:hypothetical protein LguiA_032013 [Lonicera macranthoides]
MNDHQKMMTGRKEKGRMVVDEIETILRRFGDEQSTLLDRFERLSFEVQLNQAIQLGRSLSEPGIPRISAPPPPPAPPAPAPVHHPRWRKFGFQKVMKKFLGPILGRKGARKKDPDQKDLGSWKRFSRSFRV